MHKCPTRLLAWNFERSGRFSVCSTYRMLVGTKRHRNAWLDEQAGPSNRDDDSAGWQKLWKVDVPAKFHMFLWRLAHVSLPSEDIRQRRSMSMSSSYSLCGAEDSWRHSLVDCTMVGHVWALSDMDLLEHMMLTTEVNPKVWLFIMFDTLPHAQLIRMVVALWAIRTVKWKAMHEDIF